MPFYLVPPPEGEHKGRENRHVDKNHTTVLGHLGGIPSHCGVHAS